jgi:hypothetical protein
MGGNESKEADPEALRNLFCAATGGTKTNINVEETISKISDRNLREEVVSKGLLHEAASVHHALLVEALLKRKAIDVNAKNSFGRLFSAYMY